MVVEQLCRHLLEVKQQGAMGLFACIALSVLFSEVAVSIGCEQLASPSQLTAPLPLPASPATGQRRLLATMWVPVGIEWELTEVWHCLGGKQ